MTSLLFDHSAEMCVLGSAIISPKVIPDLKALGIIPETFYNPGHSILWEAVADLEAVDLVTLCNWLRGHGKLDDVGGEDYVIQVAEEVPSAANAVHYGRLVLDAAHRRKLEANARTLMRLAKSEACTAMVTSHASAITLGAIPAMPADFAFSQIAIEMQANGLSTGFPELDKKVTTRGHPLGQVTVVAGPAKGGKTTLMLDMFLHDLRQGRRVCYATFADLDSQGLKRRLLRKLCGRELPPSDLLELPAYEKAVSWLDGRISGRIYDGFAAEDATIEAFAAWMEATHRREPWDKVYVDYAQELRSSSRAAAFSPEQNQSECARVMVQLARRLKIAVVVGSQITDAPREGLKAKTKWSRAWEEKAGWVLTIATREDIGTHIDIAYSRFGHQCSPNLMVGAPVSWDYERMAFEPRVGV